MHSKLIAGESRSGYSASYTYDANGNRASRTVNGVTETYTVDSGDKLTQVSVSGVATKTFDYDGAGRTTSIQTSSGTTSFTYDFESRVTGITYPNASTNSFTYNGLDTRVGKTDSAGTATFRRMGAGVTAPVLGDGSASFTPGISERRGSTSSFYGADYLGTNSSLYSSSETVSATRQYDAFGNLTSSSGSSANPFGFAGNWGYQSDSDSGLMLLGHRYYDASTGRFLTRDPIKDGRNWYAYCGNNPLRFVDPQGLSVAAALPAAALAASIDGPLPIGDVVAVGILAVAFITSIRVVSDGAQGAQVVHTVWNDIVHRVRAKLHERGYDPDIAPTIRDKVHEELGNMKIGRGGRDVSEEELDDAIDSAIDGLELFASARIHDSSTGHQFVPPGAVRRTATGAWMYE